ncbi:N-methylhydantoinase A [Paraburkholderia tropica]|uniref:hydantoinase/oxoprolinase family protein n=1 Tax=Paraburkholderia tropica TaxID=92647 RepID=UPI0016119BF6|nr:hydantoinase/oxoprolinase family protein [Paraburkholderia tropica]MBB3000524.1 N-methylhydantoinase A [Paraburkholderia tropica]MBB6320153.1 N-methylhydantoinase A [Paraburkholderia tropica]
MSWRIGVDSGGTFTDICLFNNETGQLEIWKVQSTPDDPSRGIIDAVQQGLERVGADAGSVSFLGHGTTVATNALIELRGVKTGLVVTDGFRDLLEIGRQKRPSLYDMNAEKPDVLVSRDLRLEVRERLDSAGRVDIELSEDDVRAAAAKLREAGVGAVAICYLYSFLNAEHEERTRALLSELLPGVFISASSAVAPEFREFERLSTTVVNCFLGPVMHRYVERLKHRLVEIGLRAAPCLTQSNGGVIGFDAAANLPVRTLLSGPSTGVVAAQAIAKQAGFANIITFDVGGTSSDVALMQNGICKFTSSTEVHGYPIKAPMFDIHTVGAGGGSIAGIDSGGLLKVGPRSAGADPGPVCYGRGNTEPTVTDANIVLQTLNPKEILGGRMKVHRELAVEAIGEIAQRLGMDTMQTAQGIISVLTANMAKAIRVISVQRGHDPRDYALMAFGGAGPLHAARLAKELDMSHVIVPLTPGTLCALGLLLTDLRSDFALTRLLPLAASSLGALRDGYGELQAKARQWCDGEQIDASAREYTRTIDLRYVGQNYELSVDVPAGDMSEATLDVMKRAFEETHRQRYGFIADGEGVQIVAMRVEALGRVPKNELQPQADAGIDASRAMTGARSVWLAEAGGFVDTPVYERSLLRAGNVFEGPAIVEQMDTTTVVLPGMRASVDPYLNLILEFV